MEMFWARMVQSATERLLLMLGWERRAVMSRVGLYAVPSSSAKHKVSSSSAAAHEARVRPETNVARGAMDGSGGELNGGSARQSAHSDGFFGTAAPKLKIYPSNPPTHVAGDPYAWNADPFAVGACSATV